MRNLLLITVLSGALSLPASPGRAQTAAPAKPKLELVQAGELRLDGKITAILGQGVWEIEASSWTSPRGVTTQFEESKTKGIQVPAAALIHPLGEAEKVPLREVKLGSHVAIIGKNGANGTLSAREVVLLEGYGSRKTVGQVSANPATSLLVGQSRAAREAGQFPRALTLINNAIAAARNANDLPGEGLASQDKALLYVDLRQFKEAYESFKRVESIGRTLSNPLLMSLGMVGAGDLLRAAGRNDQAIALLKEADPISANTEAEIRLSVLSSLARAYLSASQFDNTIATLSRVYPLEEAAGQEADGGETRLTIALLQAGDKPDAARETLTLVQARIERATDDKAKAGLLGAASLVRWRLDDRDAARAGFTQTAQLFNGAGLDAAAKKWETMAARLEAAGSDLPALLRATSGVPQLGGSGAPTDDNGAPNDAPPEPTEG